MLRSAGEGALLFRGKGDSKGLQCCLTCSFGKKSVGAGARQQNALVQQLRQRQRERRGKQATKALPSSLSSSSSSSSTSSSAASSSSIAVALEDGIGKRVWGTGYPLLGVFCGQGYGLHGMSLWRRGGRWRQQRRVTRAVQEPEAKVEAEADSTGATLIDEDDEGNGNSDERKGQTDPTEYRKTSSSKKKKPKKNVSGASSSAAPASSSDLDLVLEKVSRQVGKDLPEFLLPQIRCFASFEVDVPELVKLIKKQLQSKDSYEKVLKIPEEVLRKRLSWYASAFDVNGKELGVCLLKDLRILQVSPETTIAKRVQYLTRRGLDKSQLTKVFKKSPQLFRLDVMKSMEPRIQLFEQLGMPKDKHPQLIVKDPAIMYRSITEMEENALFLLDVGFDKQSLQHVLLKCPSLLRYNRKTMSKTVYFFQKLGLSQNEMVVMISRIPQIFSLSLEKNLMPKFSYFVRTLGWSVHDLCLAPQVLSLSMKGRILVRHQFLVRKGSFDYFKDFKRNRWLLVRDEVFAEKIARCSVQEYKVFLSKFSSKAHANTKKTKAERSSSRRKGDAKQLGNKPKKKKTTA